nr:hypothetical protein [Tanacetum cinerariifolium]
VQGALFVLGRWGNGRGRWWDGAGVGRKWGRSLAGKMVNRFTP